MKSILTGYFTALIFLSLTTLPVSTIAQVHHKKKLRVLIIDGRSVNHPHWAAVTPVLLKELNDSGLFLVDVYTAPPAADADNSPEDESLDTFNPRFSHYHVIVTTYDGPSWPVRVQRMLEGYIRRGGGLVVVHAADNAFPDWPAYNLMTGLGGWGGRNEKAGPYRYVDKEGKIIIDGSPGPAGHHGPRHPYLVKTFTPQHPIMQGLPESWMHVSDELYDQLRGPGEAMTILATAYSDPEYDGTGRNEPVLMAIRFGLGRVFHTTMGHDVKAVSGVGFMTTFVRGCEWAATGEVTFPVPADFPTKDKTSSLHY